MNMLLYFSTESIVQNSSASSGLGESLQLSSSDLGFFASSSDLELSSSDLNQSLLQLDGVLILSLPQLTLNYFENE